MPHLWVSSNHTLVAPSPRSAGAGAQKWAMPSQPTAVSATKIQLHQRPIFWVRMLFGSSMVGIVLRGAST